MIAVRKNILLDIYVSHETPNYFQGDLTCFSKLLGELLKYCIDSLTGGKICIRIDHEAIHKKNNSDTELSIIITTCSAIPLTSPSSENSLATSENSDEKNITFNTFASILRIQQLCRHFSGEIKKQTHSKREFNTILIL